MEECPLTVVQCKFHHTGCKVTLPRKEMADHMKKDSIAHISLLTAENHCLSKQLMEEKENQLCILTRKNMELEEKTKQMCLLTRKNTELEEKTTKQSQRLIRVEAELKTTKQQAIDQLQTQQSV